MNQHANLPAMPEHGKHDARFGWLLMSNDTRMPWWAPQGVADPFDDVWLYASEKEAMDDVAVFETPDGNAYAVPCYILDNGDLVIQDSGCSVISRAAWYRSFNMEDPGATGGPQESAPLLVAEISDWRLGEMDGEELAEALTPEQRQPRRVTIEESPSNGLLVTIDMGSEKKRWLNIEMNEGEIDVHVYRDDLPDVKVTPADHGTFVRMSQLPDDSHDIFVAHCDIMPARNAPEPEDRQDPAP